MRFLKVNVNPYGRKTSDCAVRAVCQACGIPYQQAAKELFDRWMDTGEEMTSPKVFEHVLTSHGFRKFGKPFHSDGTTYSVAQLCRKFGKGHALVIQVAGHWTVCKGDRLIDLWDCSRKSVYGYYSKAVPEDGLKVYGGPVLDSKEI